MEGFFGIIVPTTELVKLWLLQCNGGPGDSRVLCKEGGKFVIVGRNHGWNNPWYRHVLWICLENVFPD